MISELRPDEIERGFVEEAVISDPRGKNVVVLYTQEDINNGRRSYSYRIEPYT